MLLSMGYLNDPDNPVEIYLHADNMGIIFNVRNKKNHSLKDNTGGIGLSNVQAPAINLSGEA
jgi:hypothetical protein